LVVQALFPLPLGVYEFGSSISQSSLDYINSLEQKSNIGNRRTVATNVLEHEDMSELREFCETSLADYFETVYSPISELDLYITQSWLNYADSGEFHHIHYHPNSFVSGVFYVKTDCESDRITFYNPLPKHFRILSETYTQFNSRDWWVPAKEGLLILFPSYMDHDVPCVKHSETRISLAFNSFFKGSLGDEQMLDLLTV